jgi:hypothetical protein
VTFIEERAQEVSELAQILISNARPGLCATILLPSIFLDREGGAAQTIGFDAAGSAPNGELLRIDYHLLDDTPNRLDFSNHLCRNLLPFIEGIGKITGKHFEGAS